MRKSLLAAVMTISTATFAQMPDASSWTKGQDISDKIAWGNLKFENDPMDFWKFEKSEGGSTTTTGGLFEVYDGSKCDLYQYVQLPKGQYRLECQAYYRFGTSWDDDPKSMDNGTFENNAILYVQNGTYDIESEEFTKSVNRFENPVMPRLYNDASYKLYEDPDFTLNADGSKSYTAGWDRSDGEYTVSGSPVYGPCSVPGSLVWFENGYYSATETDAEEVYNVVEFFMKEDGWIRLGISKEAQKSADSFMATNFKMYYTGEITVNAELEAKQKQVALAFAKIAALENAYEGKLGGLVSDYVIDNYNDGTTCESIEACDEAIAQINAVYSSIMEAKAISDRIPALVKSSSILLNKTDYSGKAAFAECIAKGEKFYGDGSEVEDGDDFSVFKKYFDDLTKARLDYIMTQEAVNGVYDFTSAISYPFFCNPEYEPTYDAETQTWIPNEAALEAGWTYFDDCDGTYQGGEKTADGVTYNLPAIASEVTISGNTGVKNAWFIDKTAGGSLSVYWNDYLPCAKKWDLPQENGYNRTCQVVTNIPNGYYKLKGLAQTWTNDWSDAKPCKNHIFIQSGEQKSTSPYLEPGGWWGKDINQWKELETSLVYVGNNEVLIAAEDNGFAAFTGFRLMYYGETMDFNALLADARENVNNDIQGLALKGDVAAVTEILSAIPTVIETPEQYYAATDVLKAAQAYISEANRVTRDFDNFINDLTPKCADQPCYNPVLDAALDASDTENETLTYKGMEPVKQIYAAVEAYLNDVENLDEYAEEADVKAAIAKNAEYLSNNLPTVEKVEELKAVIGLPAHKSFFAKNNANTATEAKPADITSLIQNADFSDGRNGWKGNPTVDGNFQNAEFYNTTFNLNQVIYGLPAGCYKVQVQGFYRDGADYKASYTNWNVVAAQDPELWENNNVLLYANNATSYVTSIASELYTERGMVRKFNGFENDDRNAPMYIEWDDLPAGENVNGHPWDASVDVETSDEDGETVTTKYYFAQSMEGAYDRFVLSPDAFINEVYVMVEEGGNLSLGLVKENKIGNDWCIFDNFKLFYLGTETPTGVSSVNANVGADMFFNAAGVRTNGMTKGINIVKMSDGSVKKVIK